LPFDAPRDGRLAHPSWSGYHRDAATSVPSLGDIGRQLLKRLLSFEETVRVVDVAGAVF
jgi:hypothetical protein